VNAACRGRSRNNAQESRDRSGRGASILQRSGGVNRRGAWSSENVGMSSERGVRNPSAVSPRVPGEG
jgi:hypothetical protein